MNLFFLKIFTRNISRQGIFPVINLTGLSIGLTVVLLICAFIFNEYSFDKQFTNHERIYRANSEVSFLGMEGIAGFSSPALALAAKEEIPGVETAVRIMIQSAFVKADDILFKIEKLCWADEDFFLLFNTPFIYGSAEDVFAQPNKIALSESQANVFFGDKNSIGEILLVDGQQYEVRAVYKDFPSNSSFEGYQMIGYFMSATQSWIYENPEWGSLQLETFFMFAPNTNAATVEAGMRQLVDNNLEFKFYQVMLQPLDKIHLYSKQLLSLGNQFTVNMGDIVRVKMFSLLAAIILLVACINYMNLSTARAQKRSKEIGISKTLGEKRREIIVRLYSETGLLTLLSFISAFILAWILLPAFNLILGQVIPLGILFNTKFLLGMLLVYLATTLVAASYPALYLSGFAPLTVIRQSVFIKGSSHAIVRKGLNVLQFSVAVILIAWVIVIYAQMNYVNKKDMGYDIQNVIGIIIPNQSNIDALRNDYAAQESVSEVALSAGGFLSGQYSGRALFKTLTDMYNPSQEKNVIIYLTKIAPETIDLLQLKLIAGTTLPEKRHDDTITNVIINRKTVEYMEKTPEEVIGQMIPFRFNNEQPIYVCGVVENFHFQNLHESIEPFAFHDWNNQNFGQLLLKVKAGNLSQQLRTYEDIFRKHFPNDLFEVRFPDMFMAKTYEEDRQTSRLVLCFSFLSIFVACLGVFGLTAFMAEQRTKEIGIRKVLGASVGSIIRLFTDNYLRLLALSLVIALPVAWWIGSKYLENFAYRISLAWWMFAAAALITVVLTLFTVGWQAFKAATENPVKAIKSE